MAVLHACDTAAWWRRVVGCVPALARLPRSTLTDDTHAPCILQRCSHLVCVKETTFTATAGGIVVWRRARPVRTLVWGPPSVPQPGRLVGMVTMGTVVLSL